MNEVLQIEPTQEVSQSIELATHDASTFAVIKTDDQYAQSAEFLRDSLKPLMKKIKALFAPIITRANDTHRAALAQRNALLHPIEDLSDSVSNARDDFRQQKRIEQAVKDAEAREALARAQEAARLEKLNAAALLEQQGKNDEAEHVAAQPVIVEAPGPEEVSEAPKVEGVTVVKRRKFRVIDKSVLSRDFMVPNLKKIEAYWREHGEEDALAHTRHERAGKIEFAIEFYDEEHERFSS